MEVNANAFMTLKLAAAWLAMRLDLMGLGVLTGCGASVAPASPLLSSSRRHSNDRDAFSLSLASVPGGFHRGNSNRVRACAGVLVIAGDVDPALAGLALVYALDLTRFLKHGTNMASKSESDFNSVERIIQVRPRSLSPSLSLPLSRPLLSSGPSSPPPLPHFSPSLSPSRPRGCTHWQSTTRTRGPLHRIVCMRTLSLPLCCLQYLRPETEADPDTPPEVLKTLPPDWPTHGAIEVRDLAMRYRPEMPLVLRGISFNVEGGAKVGLVGRTGSGKSSILLALFRCGRRRQALATSHVALRQAEGASQPCTHRCAAAHTLRVRYSPHLSATSLLPPEWFAHDVAGWWSRRRGACSSTASTRPRSACGTCAPR